MDHAISSRVVLRLPADGGDQLATMSIASPRRSESARRGSRRRAVLTQFSDLLLTPENRMREYYRRSYARMRGYHYPTHFMEIPYWIPIVTSMLPESWFAHELMVVDDLDSAAEAMARAEPDDLFFFSVLDANLRQTLRLAQTGAAMILGGYTDPNDFAGFGNVQYMADVAQLPGVVPGAKPRSVLDYRLFAGLSCIPRFSLSTGCSFRCVFCTVPTKLELADQATIASEVEAILPLDFQLVFLDDKSFGEAANWRSIGTVSELISQAKPDFEGFIIQTPPSLAAKDGFLEECRELGVRYVEFGVESVNDDILKNLRKPFRTRHLRHACDISRELGLYVIPNLIMGIPQDDYRGTTRWVEDYVDIIPVVNVNWLAVHHGNERGDLGLPGATVEDRDQNSPSKSWLSPDQVRAGWDAIETIYALTDGYWAGRSTYPASEGTGQ